MVFEQCDEYGQVFVCCYDEYVCVGYDSDYVFVCEYQVYWQYFCGVVLIGIVFLKFIEIIFIGKFYQKDVVIWGCRIYIFVEGILVELNCSICICVGIYL